MISLIVQAVLALSSVIFIVASNRRIFRRPLVGPLLSTMESIYYAIGIASVVIGWYFRIRFVTEYSTGAGNPFSGPGSWGDYTRHLFDNPAASSVSQDYLFAKVLLLPLFTIPSGFKHGVRRPWLYFVTSFFTSYTFAWVFYLATRDRQNRLATSVLSSYPAVPPPTER